MSSIILKTENNGVQVDVNFEGGILDLGRLLMAIKKIDEKLTDYLIDKLEKENPNLKDMKDMLISMDKENCIVRKELDNKSMGELLQLRKDLINLIKGC